MDFVQLSILRAGGVYVDERATGEWERLQNTPAPRLSAAKTKPPRPSRLLQGLAALAMGLSDGLAGFGRRLQDRAKRSAENAAINGCKAT